MTQEPPSGMRLDEAGVHGFTLLADGRTYRVITTEQRLGPAVEPGLRDLSDALHAVYGTDFGVHDPTSISRFTDATRQAASYRKGRVLLVGDAAHVHYPAGGQGSDGSPRVVLMFDVETADSISFRGIADENLTITELTRLAPGQTFPVRYRPAVMDHYVALAHPNAHV